MTEPTSSAPPPDLPKSKPRPKASPAPPSPPPPPVVDCGETLECCSTHRYADELLVALKELNRDGLGSRFFQGAPQLMALLTKAQGGKV